MGKKDELNLSREYKYDFKDNIDSIESTGKGLSREVVEAISKAKNEPEWMLEFRLKSYDLFNKIDFPKFGPDTTKLDFNSYTYFTRYV
ncbi:MAG: Fe-S cluster assembly protein SufB, partial [Mollicutes bacterium]|nr:Fe-S cluster assembly protein SufB [Mollicutes bacterium]